MLLKLFQPDGGLRLQVFVRVQYESWNLGFHKGFTMLFKGAVIGGFLGSKLTETPIFLN